MLEFACIRRMISQRIISMLATTEGRYRYRRYAKCKCHQSDSSMHVTAQTAKDRDNVF